MEFVETRASFAETDDGKAEIAAFWGQGRASFGGLLVALIFDRMKGAMHEVRNVRSLMVSFVGPAAPEQPLTLSAEILREGNAVTQVEGRATQNGKTVAVVIGSFGQARDSEVTVHGLDAPNVVAPESAPELPFIPNVTPEFTQHIELRFAIGGMPMSGNESREMGGWMRFRKTQDQFDDAHLIALVDAWPPAILPRMKQPAPASSLSWTLEFVYPRPSIAPGEYLLYQASIDQARDGYGHIHARIWTHTGELIALSRQTVVVFG
ncbi:thioesterase family protein [Marinobacter sp. BW6]|uniref:acyl-CoA thioesterase n=1 Tax=Marinobacter sp. BW6 TaxID=2592624 RepID=UPI0011DE616F|nr:thioesterase family protein [Marinobacter sp. BW6]TYC62513.1 thioesterase family protein [Marinobacter sp. BW6]